MSWEAISAVSSAVTAVIITVTALVAVVQIRHLRSSNRLAAALELFHEMDELGHVRTYVATELPGRMKDPAYRAELAMGQINRDVHLEVRLGNYWEKYGLLLRNGLLDRQLFVDWGAVSCLRDWKALREVTRAIRGEHGELWRDFEYLAHLSAMHLDADKKKPFRQPKWREGLEELDVRARAAQSKSG